MDNYFKLTPYIYLDNDSHEFMALYEDVIILPENTNNDELIKAAKKIKEDSKENSHEVTLVRIFKINKIFEI